MKTRVRFLIALATLSLFGGCASAPSAGKVSLPLVPAWEASADTRTFSSFEIADAVTKLAPGARLDLTDSSFVPVSHAWLEQAVVWAWEVGNITGLKRYVIDGWDCEDFAAAFAKVANIAVQRAGVRAQPLLVRIYVVQEKAFGNVPAGGAHALCVFLSERGLFVLEPQGFTLIPFDKYPNRHLITEVKIGG